MIFSSGNKIKFKLSLKKINFDVSEIRKRKKKIIDCKDLRRGEGGRDGRFTITNDEGRSSPYGRRRVERSSPAGHARRHMTPSSWNRHPSFDRSVTVGGKIQFEANGKTVGKMQEK